MTRTWVVLLVTLAWIATARADKVDDLSRKLRSDADYKVRLSAALNLGKLGDRRGVPALIDALEDSDKTVRGVSASALGKLIDGSVAPETVDRAANELEAAAGQDEDAMVRSEAKKSLDAVRAVQARRVAPGLPSGAKIYVEVGPMTDNTKKSPAVTGVMRQQVLSSLAKVAPSYLTRWPTGRSPSDLDLKKAATTAYYVDGSLVALNVSTSPPHVGCSVSLLIATYPAKSLFGFMRGGAELDAGGSSESAITQATNDCVNAVLDDLVATRLVPTIQSRGR